MTSTLNDWRAQRRADKIADAELERADKLTEAEIKRQNTAFLAEQRRQEREHDRLQKAQDRAERKQARREFFAALPAHGLSALWACVIVLPLTLAWAKQAEFARDTLHLSEPFHHLFPASIEVAAWVCAFEAHRRGVHGRVFVRWMWILSGVAAVINATHGGTWQASLSLAVLSVLGVRLHSLRTGLDAGHEPGRVGRAVWRRVRYPRLSWAAASIRSARSDMDAATAWTLAWVDRYGVGPDAPRQERKIGRAIVKREAKEDRKAAKDGELTIVAGRVQRGYSAEVQAYIDAERQAAIARADEAVDHAQRVVNAAHDAMLAAGLVFGPDRLRDTAEGFGSPDTSGEQVKLSGRAGDLLPRLVTAIETGNVPENPSVQRIRDWVQAEDGEGLGVPTAMKLRDAVAHVRCLAPAEALPTVDKAVA